MPDADRTSEILEELKFQRKILSEHTTVLLAIQRDLTFLRDVQRAHGEEVGALERDINLLKRGVYSRDARGASMLTPVPEVNPALDCTEDL
jgi:hypothetical protein